MRESRASAGGFVPEAIVGNSIDKAGRRGRSGGYKAVVVVVANVVVGWKGCDQSACAFIVRGWVVVVLMGPGGY